jgi:hypothetical protein
MGHSTPLLNLLNNTLSARERLSMELNEKEDMVNGQITGRIRGSTDTSHHTSRRKVFAHWEEALK